tara:strand:+ start:154 stop:366 length:213 start_codon:yes stop_codon:yes gene_type:complete
MTPKEKAEELIDKFRNEITSFLGDNMKKINAKKCALVAVDEILNHHHQSQGLYRIDRYFWEQVKKEIQNL